MLMWLMAEIAFVLIVDAISVSVVSSGVVLSSRRSVMLQTMHQGTEMKSLLLLLYVQSLLSVQKILTVL